MRAVRFWSDERERWVYALEVKTTGKSVTLLAPSPGLPVRVIRIKVKDYVAHPVSNDGPVKERGDALSMLTRLEVTAERWGVTSKAQALLGEVKIALDN